MPRIRSESTYPLIFSELSGIALYNFLDQFLRLWPSIRASATPYISVVAVSAGGVGFIVGLRAVLHPERSPNFFINSWFALVEGLGMVFPFLLEEEIRIYCSDTANLDADGSCMVSEATFWDSFFPGPLILGSAHAGWNMISAKTKNNWKSDSRIKSIVVTTVDTLLNTFLYSRNLQTLMTNISDGPSPWVYEVGAIPVGLAIAGVRQALEPGYQNKFLMGINLAMTLNLMFNFANTLKKEFENDPDSWPAWLESIAFGLFFIMGCGVMFYKGRETVHFQIEEDPAALLVNQDGDQFDEGQDEAEFRSGPLLTMQYDRTRQYATPFNGHDGQNVITTNKKKRFGCCC